MKRKARIRLAMVCGLVILVSLTLVGTTAYAKTYRLSMGAGHPTAAIWAGMVKDWFGEEVKKRVAAKTGDTIEWTYAFGGSVAKLGGVIDAVRDGLLDVGEIQYCFTPTKLFLHNFSFATPFDSPDIFQIAQAALATHAKIKYLTEVFEKEYNQVYLGCLVINSYHLITTFPWKSMDDLKGKKIAAAGPNLPWIKGTGTVPVQSTLNEAYTSLQTGVYDGWVMFADGVTSFKLQDVAKYYTLVNFGAVTNGCITINLDTWKRLPKEIQTIMKEVGLEYTMALAKASAEKEKKAFEIMKEAGVTIQTLSDEERIKWVNMLPNNPNKIAQEANQKGMPGTETFRTWLEEQKKAGFVAPRVWQID